IICAVSVGNEVLVDWSDHRVPVSSLVKYIKTVKENITQPVTVCDNYVPWQTGCHKVAAAVDFISIHTYPVWENKTFNQSIAYTISNYNSVCRTHPGRQVVISEAGWATLGLDPAGKSNTAVALKHQQLYYKQINQWAARNNIILFFFEAFDENWKGSDDPLEPEKHWGLFYADRTPKPAIRHILKK
ncbi:MAG TPA: glycosyl hydrolase family 17 protein, partial [Spirochaetota bacterium]|nr:glycosyl hydrolase family 17 protein [Spirochaetota bacterium]